MVSFPFRLQASETVVLRIFVNTEDKGDYFMLLTKEADVLLRLPDFLEIGFRETANVPETTIEQEKYVSLKSLAPLVTFEVDEYDSALRITTEPTLLEKSIVDLGYKGPADVLYTQDSAAFINYGLNYSAVDSFNFRSLTLPWEAGISIDGTLGFSSFSYTKTDEDENFSRLFSNITVDDRITLRRVVLGDFSAYSGTLGSGGIFGGLSISKDYAINPTFRRFPGLEFTGVLETPSEVELYMNDLLVGREHLPAGSFQFMNLSGVTGDGDATFIIRDAFGRETRVENPFYLTTQLLKPGLNDYSYNVGFKRKELGQKSFAYGDPAFVGFHRYGFTRSFTGGLRAEADQNFVNLGASTTFVPWRLGETNTSVAVSNDEGKYGYGGFLSYFHGGGHFSGSFSVSGFSRDYSNLSLSSFRVNPRLQRSISAGFNQRGFGSLSASYSDTDYYTNPESRRVSIFYSRNLWRNASLQLRASRTERDETVNEIFAGLVINFGDGKSGSLSYQVQDGNATEIANIQQNPPLGPGLGCRLLVAHNEDAQNDSGIEGNAAAQYRGPYGIYSADYNRIAGQDIYDVGVSGGVAIIDNTAYLSRPVTDGFALVKAGDLDGVKVNYSNQVVGTTNGHGEVIVPNLISYYDNNLSIETGDIPVNYEIEKIEKHVSPPVRGGSIVEFPVSRIQGFTGYLYVVEQGERKPAQYWGLRLKLAGASREFIVGKGGEFYFENIPAGRYPAVIFSQDRECDFDLTVPKSDAIMVDMNELNCEIH